jgi:hypothetical protein
VAAFGNTGTELATRRRTNVQIGRPTVRVVAIAKATSTRADVAADLPIFSERMCSENSGATVS